jgi:hypothetical protein
MAAIDTLSNLGAATLLSILGKTFHMPINFVQASALVAVPQAARNAYMRMEQLRDEFAPIPDMSVFEFMQYANFAAPAEIKQQVNDEIANFAADELKALAAFIIAPNFKGSLRINLETGFNVFRGLTGLTLSSTVTGSNIPYSSLNPTLQQHIIANQELQKPLFLMDFEQFELSIIKSYRKNHPEVPYSEGLEIYLSAVSSLIYSQMMQDPSINLGQVLMTTTKGGDVERLLQVISENIYLPQYQDMVSAKTYVKQEAFRLIGDMQVQTFLMMNQAEIDQYIAQQNELARYQNFDQNLAADNQNQPAAVNTAPVASNISAEIAMLNVLVALEYIKPEDVQPLMTEHTTSSKPIASLIVEKELVSTHVATAALEFAGALEGNIRHNPAHRPNPKHDKRLPEEILLRCGVVDYAEIEKGILEQLPPELIEAANKFSNILINENNLANASNNLDINFIRQMNDESIKIAAENGTDASHAEAFAALLEANPEIVQYLNPNQPLPQNMQQVLARAEKVGNIEIVSTLTEKDPRKGIVTAVVTAEEVPQPIVSDLRIVGDKGVVKSSAIAI